MHMLSYGLYGNSNEHLEKTMVLNLQLNCRITRNPCSQILGPILLFFAPVIHSVNSADLSRIIFEFYQPLSKLRRMIPKPSMALVCFIPSMQNVLQLVSTFISSVYAHVFNRSYRAFQLWLFPELQRPAESIRNKVLYRDAYPATNFSVL